MSSKYETIGQGNFAMVKLAQHILTGTEAVKVIKESQQSSSRFQALFHEALFYEAHSTKTLNHTNIVKWR